MDIRSTIKRGMNWFIKESRTFPVILQYYLKDPIWSKKEFVTMANEGYKQNVYVYACIKQIAMGSAGIPWLLYNKKKSKKGEDTEIESHPLLDLWNKPNPKQGGTKFRESTIAYLMIEGNSYIEAAGPNNPNKPPLELYPLRPDRINILPGDKQFLVLGYEYEIGGRKAIFKQEEVLHLLMFDPLDDWFGMSPLKAASRSVDQNNQSRSWNVSLLQNGARPPGILRTQKGLSDIQFNRIENKWQEKYSGWQNAGVPMILEGGLEWQEMGLDPIDMAWLEGTKLSAREIAIAFGVPPEIIGDNSNKTYSNYQEARKAFYEETILPLMDWYRDEVNSWLTVRYGDNLYLDYDRDEIEALQEDRDKVWTRVSSANWLKVNEKRSATGYDDLSPEEGGDIILVKTTDTPITTFVANPEEEQAAQDAMDNALAPDDELDVNAEDGDLSKDETNAEAQSKAINFLMGNKSFNIRTKEQKEIYWKSVEIQRTPYYKTATNIIRKQFSKEHKSVVNIIKNSSDTKSAIKKVDNWLKVHNKDWDTILRGIYISVGEVFSSNTISSIKSCRSPFSFKAEDTWKTEVDDWLNNNCGTKITEINDVTRNKIRKYIAAGVDEGEGIEQIAMRIDALYLKKIIPNRSTVIARTEVIAASNLGSRAGAKQTGLELDHEWLDTNDRRTREWHKNAGGQVQKLDEPFEVMGEKLMFPGDISMGASARNVIQCRCTEVYSESE